MSKPDVNIPKIGVSGLKDRDSSSSSSEDESKRLKLAKPNLKLPIGKEITKAEVPSAKVEIPKIGIIVAKGCRHSSSSSSDDENRDLKFSKPDVKLPIEKVTGS